MNDRAWLFRPQVLVAALVLVAAALFALAPPGPRRERPVAPDLSGPEAAPVVERDARLLLIDRDGLERPRFVRLRYQDGAAARLGALVVALRAQLVEIGVWPEAAELPAVFLGELGVRTFAVIDFGAGYDGLSVAQERQLVASLEATVRADGIEELRVLRYGRPTAAPFGHLALPQGL